MKKSKTTPVCTVVVSPNPERIFAALARIYAAREGCAVTEVTVRRAEEEKV